MAKKLLILDMDETLLHTTTEYQVSGSYDFKFELDNGNYHYFVDKRPYLDEFMDYAFANFEVAIWTAGGDEYATNTIKNCNIDESKLNFFWKRDKCTIKISYEYGQYYGLKRLAKLKNKWDLENVLIVDDVSETAVENYSNLIKIKPFYGNKNDTELLKLKIYLETIKNESNFRSIEKRGWSDKITI